MFKLYKRAPDGQVTAYHEVWVEPQNRRIIEHWGEIGDQGDALAHRIWLLRSLDEQVETLLRPAREAGYAEIDIDQHVLLRVEYAVDGSDPEDDLGKRQALEDRLQEILGWTGLGHCDGGSNGSGTMEATCFVVDFERARTVIAETLEDTEFGDFTRIYAE